MIRVLGAVNVGGELDQLAMRGARLGFPGWPEETTSKGGKPKVDYLDRPDAAAKAREYLSVAKTPGEIAGRLLALVVMARFADEEAVAQSRRAFEKAPRAHPGAEVRQVELPPILVALDGA